MRTKQGLVAAAALVSAMLTIPQAAWAETFFVRSRAPVSTSFATRYPASSLGDRSAAGSRAATYSAPVQYQSPNMRYGSPNERKSFDYKFGRSGGSAD